MEGKDVNKITQDMGKKTKGFVEEFKKFISRGNVIDLAVGVIIGSAFTSIVNSLVNDIVMPIISVIIGGIDFSDLKLVITPASAENAEAALRYGNFLQNIVDFLLIALVVFIMVKAINSFQKKKDEAPAAPPKPSDEVVLLTEIRDLMKKEAK